MKITFNKPKEIVIVKEVKKTISELTITEITDSSQLKLVRAYTEEIGVITLWEKEDYDKIGQWTDDDVAKRIIEFYK